METTFLTFKEVCKMQGIVEGKHFNVNLQSNIIYFSNGSMIFLKDMEYYPRDPEFDRFGSLEITGAFIDEIAQIKQKAWEIIKSRIRYMLDKFNLIPKIFGSLNPAKNWVYENFYKKWKKGLLEVTKRFIQALPIDNKYLPKEYLKTLAALTGVERKRLYEGSWEYEDVEGGLFSFENIENIFTNPVEYEGDYYISCDVARHGVDKTIIAVWRGLRLFELHIAFDNDTKEVVKRIQQIRTRYRIKSSNVIIDDGGLGAGVTDNVSGCTQFVSASSPLEILGDKTKSHKNYQNLRAQCYFNLSNIVEDGRMLIDIKRIKVFGTNKKAITLQEIREQITKELEIVRQVDFEKDGKIKVVPKDVMKEELQASPDYADTLMMRTVKNLKSKKTIAQLLKERRQGR